MSSPIEPGCGSNASRSKGDVDLESLEAAVSEAGDAYAALARTLSERRRAASETLARSIERGLADLAMERTRFDVVFDEPPAGEAVRTERGIDQAEFYFSANPGEEVRPLARIASGGELSRVMLVLRTVIRTDAPGRTLVFDEVDAGIGGEAAERVGAKLRGLAERYQVLCITHLPQIAAYGTSHHRVTKSVRDGRTLAEVHRLDEESRASEIARMMTGTRVSGAVLESARELLSREAPGKREPASPLRTPASALSSTRKRNRGQEVFHRNVRVSDERARLRTLGRPARSGGIRGGRGRR